MTIIKSISAAIKSRREFKKEITQEQKRRLEICRVCPLNSSNVAQKTIKNKVMIFLNKALNFVMGVSVDDDSTCTICDCNLIFKSTQKDKENQCPLGKW